MSISTIWEVASKAEAPTLARIIAFAGSLRKESYNRKVLEITAQGARAAGAAVEIVPFVQPIASDLIPSF